MSPLLSLPPAAEGPPPRQPGGWTRLDPTSAQRGAPLCAPPPTPTPYSARFAPRPAEEAPFPVSQTPGRERPLCPERPRAPARCPLRVSGHREGAGCLENVWRHITRITKLLVPFDLMVTFLGNNSKRKFQKWTKASARRGLLQNHSTLRANWPPVPPGRGGGSWFTGRTEYSVASK